MSEERNWKRIRERLALHLPVRVRGRETPDFEWTEITRLTNVTPFGAGFPLKHPTEKGRLLYMTIPMPRQLRVFDHVEEQYRIWAVVRHMKIKTVDKVALFEVGVAFVGKRPPASYEKEPWRRYEIGANALQALAAAEEILTPVASADQRTQTRYSIAIEMRLEIVGPSGEVTATEQTVTENISKRGATIFTTLQIPAGRFIRLINEELGITVYAAIRSWSTGVDGVPRIHCEFIDKEWPL
jgi:hypothetical protein